jgi:VIT1/CCC1 family predicted Fe2+/Mn2+ transporter
MNKTTKIGLFVLLIGLVIYLIISEGLSGITRAIITGFIIGIGFALSGQFEKNT